MEPGLWSRLLPRYSSKAQVRLGLRVRAVLALQAGTACGLAGPWARPSVQNNPILSGLCRAKSKLCRSSTTRQFEPSWAGLERVIQCPSCAQVRSMGPLGLPLDYSAMIPQLCNATLEWIFRNFIKFISRIMKFHSFDLFLAKKLQQLLINSW